MSVSPVLFINVHVYSCVHLFLQRCYVMVKQWGRRGGRYPLPLYMSGPLLDPSVHPHFPWLPVSHLSSYGLEVTSTRRSLACPDEPPPLRFPAPMWSLTEPLSLWEILVCLSGSLREESGLVVLVLHCVLEWGLT